MTKHADSESETQNDSQATTSNILGGVTKNSLLGSTLLHKGQQFNDTLPPIVNEDVGLM